MLSSLMRNGNAKVKTASSHLEAVNLFSPLMLPSTLLFWANYTFSVLLDFHFTLNGSFFSNPRPAFRQKRTVNNYKLLEI